MTDEEPLRDPHIGTLSKPSQELSRLKGRLLVGILLSLIPLSFLQVLRVLADAPFSWANLAAQWIFIAGVLVIGWLARPTSLGGKFWRLSRSGIATVSVSGLVILIYILTGIPLAAWGVLGVIFIFFLNLDMVLLRGKIPLVSFAIAGLMALASGFTPVAIAQIEARFSEEEFFAFIQALALATSWILIRFVWRRTFATGEQIKDIEQPLPETQGGLRFNSRWLALSAGLLGIAGVAVTVWAYQHSFYPDQAPAYSGISAETPFLCGDTLPDPVTFDGEEVFRRILATVEAKSQKETVDFGLLALGTREPRWAEAYRTAILADAGGGLFTTPAQSRKSIQSQAALNAYYYSRVKEAFPGLFNPADQHKIQEWFTDINQRALTVEWVDWMYALAFSKWPEGPYENQESGAGLLSLIESGNLLGSESSTSQARLLSERNRDYLERYPRGWEQRFHNTDDAFIYQPEWIYNAYFQSLYTGQAPEENVRNSFEWLLLQSLPDGAPLGYNHPLPVLLTAPAYLGAQILQDGQYLWLVGRTLAYMEAHDWALSAKPGMELPTTLTGVSPTQGSCLIYSDSGLPTQLGPLAPDKIVFRDAWEEDSTYLLLNLRFAGWHRYKATNTAPLLYQSGPLVVENTRSGSYAWLPAGRSLFRDKRIPRENLNGLVISRTGMGAVLYSLAGFGGPWAQDPPYYAKVENFTTGPDLDSSQTVIEDWHHWRHSRVVYFYHAGPIVVVDTANNPGQHEAAILWHITGNELSRQDEEQSVRYAIRSGEYPAEMVILPESDVKITQKVVAEQVVNHFVYGDREEMPILQVQSSASSGGRLSIVTIFLTKDWVGAEASLTQEGEQVTLHIKQGDRQVSLLLQLE